MQRRLTGSAETVPHALGGALLFVAALIAAHLVPGALGILRPWTAALAAIGGAFAAWRLAPARPAGAGPDDPPPRPSPRGRLAAAAKPAAALGVVATGAWVLGALLEVRLQPPMHVDALSFALPQVGGWVTSGSIWHTGEFLPFLQVRTYPNNGEALALAAMLPWRDDAFVRLLALPLLAMTAVAVYATGRELRAPASTAALLGAAVAATSVAGGTALFDLKPDALMHATFAAGVFFAVRHARTGTRADLVLAGVGLGLAFGSRWYGLTAVAAVVAVWTAALALARRPPRAVVQSIGIVVGVIAAAGGFWLVRNAVLTGNPLYPVDIGPLDAPRDIFTEKFGFTVAERLTEPGFAGDELLPALWGAFGLPGLVLVAGTAGAAALMAFRGARARPLALTAAAIVVGASYAFLPGSAQGFESAPFPGIVEGNMRWLVPAAILAAGPTAWVAGQLRRGGTLVDLALLACLVVTLQRTFSPELHHLALGALLAALAIAAPRVVRSIGPPGRRPALALALAATGVIGLSIVGYLHERRYDRARYVGVSAVVDWMHAHARSGRQVGIAGNWSADRFVPIYPLFGPRLRNEVEYVGPLVDHQLREYTRAQPFEQAVRREGYDLLAVGTLSRPNFEDFQPQHRQADPEEARWAEAAGYTEVARDEDFVLLARRSGLDARLDWRR